LVSTDGSRFEGPESCRKWQIDDLLKTKAMGVYTVAGGFLVPKIEMLTPKDEHSVPPVLSGVMFDGRISFDGIATAKNFVVGSYFLTALQSSKNRDENFSVVTCSWRATCECRQIFPIEPKSPKPSFSA
jgi:hypothetical protein